MVEKSLHDIRKKGILNVFFVVNPLASIVIELLIRKFQFDSSNIQVVSVRNTSLEILNYNSIYIQPKRHHLMMQKILFSSYTGKQILKNVKRDFILYTPFSFRDSNYLINSKKCKGHFYIEEGQGSYLHSEPYDYKKLTFHHKIITNFRNKENFGDGNGNFYRNDSGGFIAIHPDSFPSISDNKKFFLKNLDSLKSTYIPKIKGIKNIALGCAERRLNNGRWETMIDTLIKIMPSTGIIKLHPSFYVSRSNVERIEKYVKYKTNSRISICPNFVILELEMLHETKTIYGPQTSLSSYTKLLGSKFVEVRLFEW